MVTAQTSPYQLSLAVASAATITCRIVIVMILRQLYNTSARQQGAPLTLAASILVQLNSIFFNPFIVLRQYL
jgi:hypothetical protein